MLFSLQKDLLFLASILSVCFLTGHLLLSKFLKKEALPNILQLLYFYAVGFGAFSSLIFSLALLRWLTPFNLVLLTILLILVSLHSFSALMRTVKQAFFEISETIQSKLDRIHLTIFLIALLSSFLFNFTPATSGYELDYNFRVPRLWLENKGIGGDYDYNHKNLFYPFLIESVYTFPLAWGNTHVPKLIHWCFGFFSSLLAFSMAKQFFSQKTAFLSMNLVFLMPIVVSEIGTAHSQLGSLFFALLSICALFLWIHKSSQIFWLCIAGLMAGLSWQAKIVGVSLIPVGLCFLFLWSIWIFRSSVHLVMKKLFFFLLFALIGCSPWLLKNTIFHKNPLFPVTIHFFGWQGHEYTNIEIKQNLETQKSFSFWKWVRLHNNILVGADPLFGPGPLIFAFLLPAWVLCKTKSVKAGFTIAFLLFLFHNSIFYGYHFRFQETKYYLPFYSLLGIISAQGIETARTQLFPRTVQAITLLGLFFPSLCVSLYFGLSKIPVFLGLESKENYLRKKVPEYELFEFTNANLSKDARILAVPSGHSAYYFNAMMITPTVKLIRESDEKRIVQQLKKDRITHFLYSTKYPTIQTTSSHSTLPELDMQLHWDLNRLSKKVLKKIYTHKDWVLYEIIYP